MEVDAEGEGGRGTVSGGCCGFREKKPKTMVEVKLWLYVGG